MFNRFDFSFFWRALFTKDAFYVGLHRAIVLAKPLSVISLLSTPDGLANINTPLIWGLEAARGALEEPYHEQCITPAAFAVRNSLGPITYCILHARNNEGAFLAAIADDVRFWLYGGFLPGVPFM